MRTSALTTLLTPHRRIASFCRNIWGQVAMTQMTHIILYLLAIQIFDYFPIDDFKEVFDIFGAAILVVEVVGVFPNI